MKINNIEHIKLLINRYYEGLTTKDEEKHIAKFLINNPELEGFEVERAIFGYLHQKPQKKSYFIDRYWQYSVAASIAIILTATLIFQMSNQTKAYAWIDGKKINDMEMIKELAQESLNNVAVNADIIETTLEPFKENNHQIQEQLSVFSDVELLTKHDED